MELNALRIPVDFTNLQQSKKNASDLHDAIIKLVKSCNDVEKNIKDVDKAAEKAGASFDNMGKKASGAADGVKKTNDHLGKTKQSGKDAEESLYGVYQILQGFGDVGSKLANVVGNLSDFAEGSNRLASGLGNGAAAGTAFIGIMGALAAALGLAAGAFVAIKMAERITELTKLGKQFGMTATQVSVFKSSLEAAGTSIEEYKSLLDGVGDAFTSIAGGDMPEADEAFKNIGVTLQDGMTKQEALTKVVGAYKDALAEGSISAEDYASFQRILGSDVEAAVAKFDAASEAQKRFDELQAKGITISQESVDATNEFNAVKDEAGKVLENVGSIIASDFLPTMSGLIKSTIESYTEGGVLAKMFDLVRIAGLSVSNALRTMLIPLQAVYGAMKSVGTAAAAMWDALRGNGVNWDAIKSGIKDNFSGLLDNLDQMYKNGQQTLDIVGGTEVRTKQTAPKATGNTLHKGWKDKSSDDSGSSGKNQDILKQWRDLMLQIDTAQVKATSSLAAFQGFVNSGFDTSSADRLAQAEGTIQAELEKAKKVAAELYAKQNKKTQAQIDADPDAKKDQNKFVEAQLEQNKVEYKLRQKAATEASYSLEKMMGTELEAQTKLQLAAIGYDSEAYDFKKKINDELAVFLESNKTATEEQKERAKSLADEAIKQFNITRELKSQATIAAELVNLTKQRTTALQSLYSSTGLNKNGQADYRSATDKQYDGYRDNVTSQQKSAEDALKAEFKTSLDRQKAGFTTDEDDRKLEEYQTRLDNLHEKYQQMKDDIDDVQKKNKELGNSFQHGLVTGLQAVIDKVPTFAKSVSNAVDAVASSLENNLMSVLQGKGFSTGSLFATIRTQVQQLIVQLLILKPLMESIKAAMTSGSSGSGSSSLIGTLISAGVSYFGGSGMSSNYTGAGNTGSGFANGGSGDYSAAGMKNAFGYAKGGAFSSGVQMFAAGGILDSATAFPMQNGMGVAGEAGPEGILPLRRDSSGSLGVNVTGGKTGGDIHMNSTYTFNMGSGDNASNSVETARKIRDMVDAQVQQRLYEAQRSGGSLNQIK